ncbi:MAG: efflux RND transporter periplasmic adaptor subunit [Candidatus Riflebacteria bacterium]|nr:efflux RND transporter periplasmic adaptor subunit [Candidatus Riflebacteria bacterium]
MLNSKDRSFCFLLFSIFVLILMLGICRSANAESGPKAESAPSLASASIAEPVSEKEGLAKLGEITGELAANRRVALSFKVSGKLKEMSFNLGDRVEADVPVAYLDSRDYEVSLKQAQAGLDVIKAKLKQQENGARPQEKKQANELVKQNKAADENAQAELKRIQTLFSVGGASKQALDAAIAKAEITATQYRSALESKELVFAGPREEDREATRAQIRQQEGVVENCKLQLEYTTLRAPFSALVAQRNIDEGAYLTNTTTVYTLVENDPIIAGIDVPDTFISHFKKGLQTEIKVFAFPKEPFKGQVIRISPVVDQKTRSFRVEISIRNPDFRLQPGMFVTARFLPEN